MQSAILSGSAKLKTRIDQIMAGTTSATDVTHVLKVLLQAIEDDHTADIRNFVLADAYSAIDFQAKYGVPRPTNVMPVPIVGNGTVAQIHNYDKELEKFYKVEGFKQGWKKTLLQYFDEDNKDMLKIVGDPRALMAYPMEELVAQVKENFAVFKIEEIKGIITSLGAEMQEPKNMVMHLVNFERSVKVLADNKQIISEMQKIEAIKQGVGGEHGPYSEALKDFSKMEERVQTVANLRALLIREHDRLKSITAQAAGFAAAVQVTQQQQVAVVPGGGGTGRGGRGGGRGPAGQGPGRGRGGRGGRHIMNGGRIVGIVLDTCYCWSHGPNGGVHAHDSAACPDPQTGHVSTATAANIQGGRTIFCLSSQRHLWPHP